MVIGLFQTQLENGTYKQHFVRGGSTVVVFTSFSGIFRIEVSYNNLVYSFCISSISYEFLSESYTCTGELFLSYLTKTIDAIKTDITISNLQLKRLKYQRY